MNPGKIHLLLRNPLYTLSPIIHGSGTCVFLRYSCIATVGGTHFFTSMIMADYGRKCTEKTGTFHIELSFDQGGIQSPFQLQNMDPNLLSKTAVVKINSLCFLRKNM